MQLEQLVTSGTQTGSMHISMHRNQCISMDFQIVNSLVGITAF